MVLQWTVSNRETASYVSLNRAAPSCKDGLFRSFYLSSYNFSCLLKTKIACLYAKQSFCAQSSEGSTTMAIALSVIAITKFCIFSHTPLNEIENCVNIKPSADDNMRLHEFFTQRINRKGGMLFMENKTILEKEIDLIQSCISRMAQNSFVIKGWLITLVTVILALLPDKVDAKILCGVVIVASLCFWYLDAYFLKLERLYRWKYEWVITNRGKDLSHLYDLNPNNHEMWPLDKDNKAKKPPSILSIMFSKSLIPLYAIMIVMAVVIIIYSATQGVPIDTAPIVTT